MILYLTLGTNDPARAIRFYDAALAPLGIGRRVTEDDEAGYGLPGDGRCRFWITRPLDGKPSSAVHRSRYTSSTTRLSRMEALRSNNRPVCAKASWVPCILPTYEILTATSFRRCMRADGPGHAGRVRKTPAIRRTAIPVRSAALDSPFVPLQGSPVRVNIG